MVMKNFQVTLETVTPLFLGGSNPSGIPELRAPSFRGALRFWFRALLGGVIGDDSQEVFKKESEVFGSTDHASPVVVRVEPGNLSSYCYKQIVGNRSGLTYLLFSARPTKKEKKEKKETDGREAIRAGIRFELKVSQRAPTTDLKPLKAAYASLWLLTHLGGLGTRSRRGGGNLQAKNLQATHVTKEGLDDLQLPSLLVCAQKPQELKEELQKGLRLLREWAAKTFNGSLTVSLKQPPPTFDVLHPKACKIYVVDKVFNDWQDALNSFGEAMKSIRDRYQPDYKNVKSVIQRGSTQTVSLPEPIYRSVWGLPIVFYYRSSGRRFILKGMNYDRRASPLIVRVVQLANRKHTLVLTVFYSALLPSNEDLVIRGTREERKVLGKAQVPPLESLDEFLKQIEGQLGSFLEVSL